MAVTSVLKDLLQKEVIRALEKKLVFADYCNQKTFSLDKSGKIATIQTIPDITANKVAIANAGNDITLQNVAIAGENIEITELIQDGFGVNDLDQVQSNLDLAQQVGSKMSYAIRNVVDADVAAEYANAATVLDDGALDTASNGGAGFGIIASPANIYETITKARRDVAVLDVSPDELGVFLSPKEVEVLKRASLLDGSDSGLEARKGAGYSGKLEGFDIYETNNLSVAAGIRHCLVVRKSAINLVMQMNKFDVRESSTGFRHNVLYELAYGIKTFAEKAKEVVDIRFVA